MGVCAVDSPKDGPAQYREAVRKSAPALVPFTEALLTLGQTHLLRGHLVMELRSLAQCDLDHLAGTCA